MINVDELIKQFPPEAIKVAKLLTKDQLLMALANQITDFLNKNIGAIYEKIKSMP